MQLLESSLKFHDVVTPYASPCSVFKIKAKLTHKDLYLIGTFLIFYMVLFSLHSTPWLLSGRPWNNDTIQKVVCNFSILDVCRRCLQHGFVWSKWTWYNFQNVRNRTIFLLSRGTTLKNFRALFFSFLFFLFEISKLLTQAASKSCISMQLFGSIFNLFDDVAEVWNTSW